jgi:hypothetical protein
MNQFRITKVSDIVQVTATYGNSSPTEYFRLPNGTWVDEDFTHYPYMDELESAYQEYEP